MLEAFFIFRHDWISNSQLQLIGALTVRNETLLLEYKKMVEILGIALYISSFLALYT